MPWFDPVSRDPRDYERLQLCREDYRHGIEALSQLSQEIIRNKKNIEVLDIAGGTGIGSANLCGLDNVKEITVLDSDPQLLAIAAAKSEKIKTMEARMQDFSLPKKYNLVIASYAYHHLPDKEKTAFCKKLASYLSPDGEILLLEICGARGKEIEQYYDDVMERSPDNPDLARFLKWTAARDTAINGEFKVPLDRVLEDFKEAGLTAIETRKVWAASNSNAGTYLIRLKKKH